MHTPSAAIRSLAIAIATALLIGAAAGAYADDDVPGPATRKIQYSPYPAKTFPNRVYFGDTHLHTSYSADAGMIGNTLKKPTDAAVSVQYRNHYFYIDDRDLGSKRAFAMIMMLFTLANIGPEGSLPVLTIPTS